MNLISQTHVARLRQTATEPREAFGARRIPALCGGGASEKRPVTAAVQDLADVLWHWCFAERPGLRQPSGAFKRGDAIQSARGLAQSKTLRRLGPLLGR